MSKVTLDYPHLDNAQELYDLIIEYYNDFSWSDCGEGDRLKNGQTLQYIIDEYNSNKNIKDKLPIELWYVTLVEGDKYDWCVMYLDSRLNRYVALNLGDIQCTFDFCSPIDVMAWFDEHCEDASRMESQYQIKYN